MWQLEKSPGSNKDPAHKTKDKFFLRNKTTSSLAPLKPPDWRGHVQRPHREKDAQRAPPGPAPSGAFTAQVHTSKQVSLQIAPALRTSRGCRKQRSYPEKPCRFMNKRNAIFKVKNKIIYNTYTCVHV